MLWIRSRLHEAALCLALALASFVVFAASPPAVIELTLQGGQVVGGARVIRLKRDDAVTLVVRSDKADELHVHGYNLKLKLLPNQAATLSFVAKHTGRFTFELHKAGTELGAFEVYPE
jgi:hypothetical protein